MKAMALGRREFWYYDIDGERTTRILVLRYRWRSDGEFVVITYCWSSDLYKASHFLLYQNHLVQFGMSNDENNPSPSEPSRKRSGSALHMGPRKKAYVFRQ
jgi:hypothetical protein